MHEKLDVLTCGPIPPNPAEIMGSKRMAGFMEEMKGRYDKILLDSSPIGSVTDPVVVSRLADSTIYVVHGGSTTREEATRGSTLMRNVDTRVMGTVINNIDFNRENYYYFALLPSLLPLLRFTTATGKQREIPS